MQFGLNNLADVDVKSNFRKELSENDEDISGKMNKYVFYSKSQKNVTQTTVHNPLVINGYESNKKVNFYKWILISLWISYSIQKIKITAL